MDSSVHNRHVPPAGAVGVRVSGAAAAAVFDDVPSPADQVSQGLLEVAPVHRVEEEVEGKGGVVGQLSHLDSRVMGK